jgi:alkanesulfonate monooxygenase SsuD/methylene tetrahydromethanopterin reductase-like flavin-dependent oxidoreductase (luciferase family)
MTVRLGIVILPEQPWREAGRSWRAAEALGFAHGWTYDHLSWRTLRDAPWHAALPTLTAAAAVTERIRLGPLVASPNFRHPVPFARELVTLDDISGGRLVVGLGAGGTGWDATVLGHAPWSTRERAERFDEFVTLTDRLLRDPVTSFTGRYYSAEGARSVPGCVQRPRPPFAIAADGPRGMALAARFADTWVTTGVRTAGRHPLSPVEGARVVREQIRRLEDACAGVGRNPSTLGRLVLSGPALEAPLGSRTELEDALGGYGAVGVTDFVVHRPRPSPPYEGDVAHFEGVVSEVAGRR